MRCCAYRAPCKVKRRKRNFASGGLLIIFRKGFEAVRANLDCESDVNGKTAIYATIPAGERSTRPNTLTVYRGAYRK